MHAKYVLLMKKLVCNVLLTENVADSFFRKRCMRKSFHIG